MSRQSFLPSLIMMAAISIPGIAVAQSVPYGSNQPAWTSQNAAEGNFFRTLRSLDLSREQRVDIRSIVQSRSQYESDRELNRQIVAVLTPEQRRELNRRLRGGDGDRDGDDRGYGYSNSGAWNGRINGVIDSFQPFNLQLAGGPHVYLHQGTVINPTGATLQSGMRVVVIGSRNADGTINANEIDVANGYGPYRGY